MGKSIGSRMLDVLVLREKGYKRETRIINVLLFIKTTVWKVSDILSCPMVLFGRRIGFFPFLL